MTLVYLLLFLCCLLAYQGYDKNDQFNRMSWFWTLIAAAVASALVLKGEWAKGLLLAWVGYTVMMTTPVQSRVARSDGWKHPGWLALMLAGGYLALVDRLEPRALLAGLAGLGPVITAWAWYSVTRPTDHYHRTLWRLPWVVYDESRVCPRAGQGNANHAQSLVVVSLAASLGLATIASPWWGLLALPNGFGIYLCRDHRAGWLTQGIVQAAVVVAVAGVWWWA